MSRILDLVENSLLGALYPTALKPVTATATRSIGVSAVQFIDRLLSNHGLRLAMPPKHSADEGVDWPAVAQTMVGRKRLRNIRELCAHIETDKIPGDWVECGVWRGGASIMARWCLDESRSVVCCDSFEGLPYDPGEPQWAGYDYLKVPVEEVVQNFKNYLCYENVRMVKGWFKDTLPGWVTPIAILRCDGDMYSSTMQILANLYHNVVRGGYVIIDDYNLPDCRRAVQDFCNLKHIAPQVKDIDGMGAYWSVE